ncbi:MAG: FG-GAP-like repeat-containing protein [Planctomycetota bacterium]|jgi:hypothetical protein
MKHIFLMIVVVSGLVIPAKVLGVDPLNLGPEEVVEADGVDIGVGAFSVPSFVDWDSDNLGDLVVGCGYGKVYWDDDAHKDLLVGQSDGTIKIFLNVGTESDPNFDSGTLLQKGPPGSKVNIDVGARATPCVVDWNNDDKKDLVIGAYDGKIHIFLNEGTDTEPDFLVETRAQENGSDLDVPTDRSSPDVFDVDDDGKKDLIAGNTEGQLLFYNNVGTDAAPNFWLRTSQATWRWNPIVFR